MDIEKRLRNLVSTQLALDEADIRKESDFVDDLGCDSLDAVELMMIVEEEFKEQLGGLPYGEIPESDANRLKTFGQLLTYVESGGKTLP